MAAVEQSPMGLVAKTMAGMEPILAAELEQLGATGIRPLKRAVAFDGDQKMMYRANYELRSALRILLPIHQFPAYNERNLYEGIREVDWSKWLDVSGTLAVDAIAQGEVFRHSQYAALLAKDAIVDQFRDRTGRRPNVNPIAPHLRINLHINGTQVEVSVDSSGDSLHRRGYRRDTVEAPLSEVLAAGMILLTGWDGQSPFVDPMCGSGTLAIEAAMMAMRIPPQIKRPGFGFQKWPDYQAKIWKSVVAECEKLRLPEPPGGIIFASDRDSRARNATSINVMSLGLEASIHIEKSAFEALKPPTDTGTLVTNPPYDERLKVEDVQDYYTQIGNRLKQSWTNWDAWIISANRDALKHIGLRPSRRITLFNGALECSFQKFELYAGAKYSPEIKE